MIISNLKENETMKSSLLNYNVISKTENSQTISNNLKPFKSSVYLFQNQIILLCVKYNLYLRPNKPFL